MTGNNPKPDFANDDVHTKFNPIRSIRSQDIERKQNFGNKEGPSKGNNFCKFGETDMHLHVSRYCQYLCICQIWLKSNNLFSSYVW